MADPLDQEQQTESSLNPDPAKIQNEENSKRLKVVSEIPLSVTCVLGSSSMTVNQLLKLAKGSVIELDKTIGEPIDLLVNGRLVGRGEIVIIENRIGITLTDVIRESRNA